MVGENWQELSEFILHEAQNAFQRTEPRDGDMAESIQTLRRELPDEAEAIILDLVNLGWHQFFVWLSTAANRERLAEFVNRTEHPWLAWWSTSPTTPPPGVAPE